MTGTDRKTLYLFDVGRATQREIAKGLGWTLSNGDPDHKRVGRALGTPLKEKLVIQQSRGVEITEAGRAEVTRIKPSQSGGQCGGQKCPKKRAPDCSVWGTAIPWKTAVFCLGQILRL